MVDYLKVSRELMDDPVVSNTVQKINCADKLTKGFVALDKSLKTTLVIIKFIEDVIAELEAAVENDEGSRLKSKIDAVQLLIDVMEQLMDTVKHLDGDAIKKSWEFD